MKKFILLLAATFSLTSVAVAHEPPASSPNAPNAHGPKKTRKELKQEVREQMREKREELHAKIQAACGADIQTAGCSGKTGGEMMQCMRTYKEANPNFKVSEACREAHSERRELREEARDMKKEMRNKIHQGAGQGQPPASGTPTTSP